MPDVTGLLAGAGLVAAGAALGAPVRWAVTRAVVERRPTALPLGTLLVNVAGSLLLGALVGTGREVHLLLGTGFCGALTTFSAFSVETAALAMEGRRLPAALVAIASVGLCALAAAAGFAIARATG